MQKDDKKAFVRVEMSEYQKKHEMAKLIRAPPAMWVKRMGGS